MKTQIAAALMIATLVAHADVAYADDTDHCLDEAMALQVGAWEFSGQLENYGTLIPLAGSVTISGLPSGGYRTVGSVGPNTFTNDASINDLRTRSYNGDAVTSTQCEVWDERFLIVQRYVRKTDQGDVPRHHVLTCPILNDRGLP